MLTANMKMIAECADKLAHLGEKLFNETEMKYKVGDRVKVKSLQWFNENSDDNDNVVFADGWHFSKPMSIYCGKELIIERISYAVNPPHYMMRDNMFAWTDEMIEGLVEEETYDFLKTDKNKSALFK